MTLMGDAKFTGRLTCGLKSDIRNLVNFHASSRKSENIHFDWILLSKTYKDLDEKMQKSYVSWHWRVMQSLKKNWFLVPKKAWGISWIFTQPLKKSKNLTSMSYFCTKYMRFELKKYRAVIFHDTKQWCQICINPSHVVSKMTWEIGWNFIRALKNFSLMGSFCQKHIIFQLKYFGGIMCHDNEGSCKM